MLKKVDEILKRNVGKNDLLVVAVSGGPDSVCLLDLLRRLNYRLVVAHFNHQLRGKAADRDEQLVIRLAKQSGLLMEVGRADVKTFARKNKLGPEEAARKLRYQFLDQVARKYQARFIVLAHHRDDNLETILMHFLRGAGLRGLIGLKLTQGNLLRPLLVFSKQEILEYCQQYKLKFRTDATNRQTKFTRNYLRLKIIPLLKQIYPDFEKVLLKNAGLYGEIEEFLNEQVKKLVKQNEIKVTDFLKLPEILQKQLIEQIYIQQTGSTEGLALKQVGEVQVLIKKNHTGKCKKLGGGLEFRIEYGKVRVEEIQNSKFKIQNEERSKKRGEGKEKRKLVKGEDYIVSLLSFRLACTEPAECVRNLSSSDCLPASGGIRRSMNGLKDRRLTFKKGEIILDQAKAGEEIFTRNWQKGDFFYPLGLGGKKKLQDFFTDQKITVSQRKVIPIFTNTKGDIMAVGKLAIDERFKVDEETRGIIKIKSFLGIRG